MTLKDQLSVMPAESYVRVGTDNGQGWILYGTVESLSIDINGSQWEDRTVEGIYYVHERDRNTHCIRLEEGFAIVVQGYENGRF